MYGAFYTDPMPGENKFEKGKSAEDGENHNPYYNPGFEDLDGDGETGTGEEEAVIPETEPQLQQVQEEARAEDGADVPPTEDEAKPDNAVTDSFSEQWKKGGTTMSIADQKQSIESNYADGAIEQAANLLRPQTEEALTHANSDFEDTGERSAEEQEDQEIKNVAESLTAQAMLATDEAQKASEDIALGSNEADLHESKMDLATETVSDLASAGAIAMQDASDPAVAERLKSTIAEATAMAEAATAQVEETRANVEEAQTEAEELAEADQAQAAEATQAAETAGTVEAVEATADDTSAEAPVKPVFENLDNALEDDQKQTIIDAMVADNPYNSPENKK